MTPEQLPNALIRLGVRHLNGQPLPREGEELLLGLARLAVEARTIERGLIPAGTEHLPSWVQRFDELVAKSEVGA